MSEIKDMISGERMQFAVLIDADNISSKYAATIFEELDKFGSSTYRRIYGNWSKGNGWSEGVLLEYSIMPVQQFSYLRQECDRHGDGDRRDGHPV